MWAAAGMAAEVVRACNRGLHFDLGFDLLSGMVAAQGADTAAGASTAGESAVPGKAAMQAAAELALEVQALRGKLALKAARHWLSKGPAGVAEMLRFVRMLPSRAQQRKFLER